jgi:hypothetical protein
MITLTAQIVPTITILGTPLLPSPAILEAEETAVAAAAAAAASASTSGSAATTASAAATTASGAAGSASASASSAASSASSASSSAAAAAASAAAAATFDPILFVKRDGSQAFTGHQPMGGFKLTGLAAATANGDAVRFEQATLVVNNLSDLASASTARTNLGVAYGKQSIWVPASSMTPRSTNGAAPGLLEMATNKNMVATLDYDSSTQEFAQFDIRMPKSWNESSVTFIPVWSHPSTTVNFGVVWGLDAVAVSDDDTLDVAFGTEQTSTDTGGTTNDSYQGPESSAIAVAGSPAAGDLVMFRIHRNPANASDTMAVDARLHGVLLLYTNDTTNDT